MGEIGWDKLSKNAVANNENYLQVSKKFWKINYSKPHKHSQSRNQVYVFPTTLKAIIQEHPEYTMLSIGSVKVGLRKNALQSL